LTTIIKSLSREFEARAIVAKNRSNFKMGPKTIMGWRSPRKTDQFCLLELFAMNLSSIFVTIMARLEGCLEDHDN
jgi:hypothetical protein